jgi:isocitrate lyase
MSLFCPQSDRFKGLIRPYTAEQVVSKRGTIEIQYPSAQQGKKLYSILKGKAAKGEVSHTYGA